MTALHASRLTSHVFATAPRLDPERDAIQGVEAIEQLAQSAIRLALPIYRSAIDRVLDELRSLPSLDAGFARFPQGARQATMVQLEETGDDLSTILSSVVELA